MELLKVMRYRNSEDALAGTDMHPPTSRDAVFTQSGNVKYKTSFVVSSNGMELFNVYTDVVDDSWL